MAELLNHIKDSGGKRKNEEDNAYRGPAHRKRST